MRNRTKIILASSAIFALMVDAVGIVSAERSGHGGMMRHGGMMSIAEKIFDRFDVDKNGAISKAEIDSVRKQELARVDADGDGKLSLDEFQILWTELTRERMVDHFQSLDDDGDALVTMAEITRPMDRMLSYLDRNNDGAITKDELRRGHRKSGKTYRHHDDEKD